MKTDNLRLKLGLVVTYIFLAVIAGWLSFSSRPMKVASAFELQQTVWNNLGERGKSGSSDSFLVRVHSSRILFPALMQIPMKLGISGEKSFSFLRLTSIVVAYILFHLFLVQWFSDELAFCGTLFMAATVPLTFNNYFEIPTDFIEIIIFTLGVWLVYREKYLGFCLVVLIGTLNRESTAVLPVFLLFRLFDLKKVAWLFPVFTSGLCWLMPLLFLRWWTGTLHPHGYGELSHNLNGLSQLLINPHPYNNYLFWLYLFGTFWFLPFIRWKYQSSFFKRLLLSLPVCMVAYFLIGGFFNEPREIVNLYPLLVPASLFALFPNTVFKSQNSLQYSEIQSVDAPQSESHLGSVDETRYTLHR